MGERLYGLDALRGLAALVVVLFHLGLPIAGAHLAVDFFFMLSGFVMARTYEHQLLSGAIGRWQFLWRRYRRLWGWMALGTTIGLGVRLAQFGFSGELLSGYGLMLLLLPAVTVSAAPYLLNQPLWSITYELLANAVHAFGLARLNRRALALLAVICALGLAHAIITSGFPRGGFPQYHWLALWRVGLGYVLGILIYRLFGDQPPLRVPFVPALAILPAYVAAVWLYPLTMAPLAFILCLAPLMIFGGMGARFQTRRRHELAAVLGAISFPLYALHVPLIALLQQPYGLVAFMALAAAGLLWHRRGTAVSLGALRA